MTLVERARRYLAALPPAIAGSGGHTATYTVAVALVRGFDLPPREAWDIFLEWNAAHARPPWSEADLRHKLDDATKSERKAGYLLNDRERSVPCPGPRPPAVRPEDKAAARRADWPPFAPLSDATLAEIATLRGLPFEAIDIADAARLLAGAVIDGHRCFVIREDTFAQARRLDGGNLPTQSGPKKAKNLPGSQGCFIGRVMLGGPESPVLLTEGAIGLLEAIAASWLVDADSRWGVLAATGASSRFDDTWLKRLRGRRVRIVPDSDKTGLEAAGKWAASLRQVGCTVDAFTLPDGLKDIGDVVTSKKHHPVLREIFTL